MLYRPKALYIIHTVSHGIQSCSLRLCVVTCCNIPLRRSIRISTLVHYSCIHSKWQKLAKTGKIITYPSPLLQYFHNVARTSFCFGMKSIYIQMHVHHFVKTSIDKLSEPL